MIKVSHNHLLSLFIEGTTCLPISEYPWIITMGICAPLMAQFHPWYTMGTITWCKHISAFFWALYFVFFRITNILQCESECGHFTGHFFFCLFLLSPSFLSHRSSLSLQVLKSCSLEARFTCENCPLMWHILSLNKRHQWRHQHWRQLNKSEINIVTNLQLPPYVITIISNSLLSLQLGIPSECKKNKMK